MTAILISLASKCQQQKVQAGPCTSTYTVHVISHSFDLTIIIVLYSEYTEPLTYVATATECRKATCSYEKKAAILILAIKLEVVTITPAL